MLIIHKRITAPNFESFNTITNFNSIDEHINENSDKYEFDV